MRRACIDIGSNTTRLLVADCAGRELVELRQERAFTLIGPSIGHLGAIPAAKLAEVLEAVVRQHALARELGAERIRCVATAAVRRASNGEVLARLIAGGCDGLELEILDGTEEARLAFIGAAWSVGATTEMGLGVVDAGGGSSELVVGQAPDKVEWSVSLPLGSGVITHAHLGSDPPTDAELGAAREGIREALAGVRPPDSVQRLVAVGGSATSVRLLAGPIVDPDAVAYLLRKFRGLTAAELAGRYGVELQRARLLTAGLLILGGISELFDRPLEIGRGGLREGLLLTG